MTHSQIHLFIHPYLPIQLPILPFTYPQGPSSIHHVSKFRLSIHHSSIPLSISLTICPSICSSFCSPTLTINHLSTYLLNCQPIHRPSHPSFLLSIHMSITYSPIHLPTYPAIYSSFTFIHPSSIRSSICPSVCPSFYMSSFPLIHPFTHPSTYASFIQEFFFFLWLVYSIDDGCREEWILR